MVTNKMHNEIASENEDKIAIIEGDIQLTYRELKFSIEKLSDYLTDSVQNKMKRVGLREMSPTGLLVSYYACQRANQTPVAVPFKDIERVKGAITEAKVGMFLHDPMQKFELEHVRKEMIAQPMNLLDEREALVLFTSGTTSRKLKGVKLSHSGISSSCRYMNDLMEVESNVVELVFAPLDHAYGFGRCHSILSVGGTVILPQSLRSINRIFEPVERYSCTALSTPPSILSSLLRLPDEKVDQLARRIEYIQTGAMRFDITFRKKLLSSFPKTRIFLHYGLSEAMRVTLFELNARPDKIHTEGLPSRDTKICIFLDHKPVERANVEGLIGVKGANLCLGYLDEKLWKKQLIGDCFVTSDKGVLDDDGYLVFKGRSDDVMNVNGVLVHPNEVEEKISDVWPELIFSVVGVLDPLGLKDTIIVLCVQKGFPITQEELASGLKNTDMRLIPQRIIEFEELPKTRTGKINRNALSESSFVHLKNYAV